MPRITVMHGHRNLVALLKAHNDPVNQGAKVTEHSSSGFITIERSDSLTIKRDYWRPMEDSTWESVLLNKSGEVEKWDNEILVLVDGG